MDFIDGQEPDGTNLKHMAPLFGDMLPGEQQREANMNRMKAMRAERKFKARTLYNLTHRTKNNNSLLVTRCCRC
eukprot:COSAG02_NODE_8219_length_2654_cov_1.765949_2_plen_74_part_00